MSKGKNNQEAGEWVKVSEPAMWRGRQGWFYMGVFRFKGETVRITIERDSYDFQSNAYAEIFAPSRQWNRIAYIPYPLMTGPEQPSENEFVLAARTDVRRLKDQVAGILAGLLARREEQGGGGSL